MEDIRFCNVIGRTLDLAARRCPCLWLSVWHSLCLADEVSFPPHGLSVGTCVCL